MSFIFSLFIQLKCKSFSQHGIWKIRISAHIGMNNQIRKIKLNSYIQYTLISFRTNNKTTVVNVETTISKLQLQLIGVAGLLLVIVSIILPVTFIITGNKISNTTRKFFYLIIRKYLKFVF
jgi:hypothetical protein